MTLGQRWMCSGQGHDRSCPGRRAPAAGATGDQVYGADPTLRSELETRGVGYVLAVAGDSYRADALLRRVPAPAWQCVSAGRGAKGHRLYDWEFVCLDDRASHPGGQAGQHWLLVRRNRTTGELAFYRCWTPRPVLLATLVRVAGLRWTIEERFQTGKGLVGLDQHQVRRWRTWYRWTTLAMVAHAFLVVAAVTEHARHKPPSGLISLTCNEVQHLFAALLTRPADDLAIGCAGRPGDADISNVPAPATTNNKKPGTLEDHDPRRICRPTLPRNVTRAAGGG
jgi:hypothetical protein